MNTLSDLEEERMIKTGIFSWFSYSLPIEQRLRLIKEAGFDATSLWWGDENKHLQPEMAKKIGLDIDNIHTPFNHPNELWIDGLAGEDYLNTLKVCINDCAQYSIPAAVIHITGFSKPPEITHIGLERIRRLVDFAENKQVYLAFENLNFLQHLDYIFENIKSDYLGFCYDTGHENCFHQDADCLSRYGERLFAVHIDDNFGDHDTHLLPFDGTVNWNSVRDKLKKSKDISYLTLEVDFNPNHDKSKIYKGVSAEDFLAQAYERALKLI
jgi:sugar phosphate isomerase/epimerase